MRKNLILALSFGLSAFLSYSQLQGTGGVPHASQLIISSVEASVFAQPNIKTLRLEDSENDVKGNGPWRFGFANDVDFNLQNSGQWIDLPNGGKTWLFVANCTKALSINFLLKDLQLSEGNELFIYNPDQSVILGKFTANHFYKGRLGTELIQGSTAVIEYYLAPGNLQENASLTIERIVHGYRTTHEFEEKAFGNSGGCNININCPDGTDWAQEKRSAVMLINGGGTGFCSGALVNNTLNDGKPYILTANHCYNDPTNWVFRFNWESASCTNPGTEPTFSSLSGAILRARRTNSDFCLVEITGGLESGAVPSSFNPFYAGWDNSGANPTATVCLHHPSGDIKKISFDDDPTYPVQSTVNSVISDVDGSWEIQWNRNTTTEGGSSGSPLFDQNHRIIGQLWGGGASCINLTRNDYFGRFHTSWEPTASNSTNQLKFWLDPTNIGALVIDGFDPNLPIANLDASLIVPNGVNETYCSANTTPQVTLVNLGTTTLTSAEIHYGFDGVADQTFSWTGTLGQYENEVVILPTSALISGPHTFSASADLPNGGTDEFPLNNQVSSTFYAVVGGENVTLNLTLDCYASETSWELKDQNDVVLYKSYGYANDTEGLVSYPFCLADECYTFSIYDKFGDGMSGCASGDGNYQIIDASSTVRAQILTANANFGSSNTQAVCIGISAINELSETSFNLFPNPAKLSFIISSKETIIDRIECVTLAGHVVLTQNVNAISTNVNVSQLSAGIYFMNVFAEGKESVVRLVVE